MEDKNKLKSKKETDIKEFFTEEPTRRREPDSPNEKNPSREK